MNHSLIFKACLFAIISYGQLSLEKGALFYHDLRQEASINRNTADRRIPVLFVQWQYPSGVTAMHALEVRQRVESEIGKALKRKGIGEWFSGDLGPGGGNMLFQLFSNREATLEIIHDVTKKEGINKETVIAERVYTGPREWKHKVIFPKDYRCVFNDR